jgi:hypothetical protein
MVPILPALLTVGVATIALASTRRRHARRLAWEGRFSGHERRGGVLVPLYGEVGWHVGDRLELVWKGHVSSISFA